MPIVVGVRARAAFGLDRRRTDARRGQSRDEAVKDLIPALRPKEGEVLGLIAARKSVAALALA